MTIQEAYNDSVEYKLRSMILLIEIAVEKNMFDLEDDFDKIDELISNHYTEEWDQEIRAAGKLRGYW